MWFTYSGAVELVSDSIAALVEDSTVILIPEIHRERRVPLRPDVRRQRSEVRGHFRGHVSEAGGQRSEVRCQGSKSTCKSGEDDRTLDGSSAHGYAIYGIGQRAGK